MLDDEDDDDAEPVVVAGTGIVAVAIQPRC